MSGRTTLVWVVVVSSVGTAVSVGLLLTRPSVALGFALGVALLGTALSVGTLGAVALSGVGGDSLSPVCAGALSGAVLTFGPAATLSADGDPHGATVVLVGAGVGVVTGFLLGAVAVLSERAGEC
jgi:hypothetical protein